MPSKDTLKISKNPSSLTNEASTRDKLPEEEGTAIV
jgi:hypothetical protein